MFQFMPPALPPVAPRLRDEATEIERLRARHRRLQRNQVQHTTPSPRVEALDEDQGRTRKISAKWRQKQQLALIKAQQDDGNWPVSAGTEMHMGFNAFDFSSSPEAFYDEPELAVEIKPEAKPENSKQKQKERMAEVAKQVASMSFNSASLWERRFPGLRQPGGPIRQLPTFSPIPMWVAPVHYATHDDQRRALYCQAQHFT